MIKDYLNLNNFILVISGLVLAVYGAWQLYRFRSYMFGGGVFLIGIGNLLFGITNGFTDQTPRGRLFFKAAMFSYILGFLSVGYTMRHIVGI